MPRFTLILVALAALLLAACSEQEPDIALEDQIPADMRTDNGAPDDGEAPDDGDAAATVELIAGDLYFDNEPSTLPVGTTRFVMENEGNLPHDLYVEELGDLEIIPVLQAGEVGEGDVTLDAGSFTFYCDIPGHRAAGMEFTVTVE
jgi:plastocyanin